MKLLNTLIAAGLLLVPNAISAKRLSADEAEQIATAFIRNGNTRLSGKHLPALNIPQLTLVARNGTASRSSAPPYYIFNVADDNGYVIVAGDDRFNEILGYADSGNYLTSQTNPGLEYWLDCLAEEMASAQTNHSTMSRAPIEAPDVAPLLTTKWGQSEPYNRYCYVSSGRPTIGQPPQHAPTGCVATALAQVVNYHKWPSVYRSGDKVFEYKWDLMLPTYVGTEPEESIEQVANLMSHCGISVGMSYGYTSSGASPYAIFPALVNTFNYDGKAIRTLQRNTIGYERLHTLLYNELKEKRPIIVGGSYPNGDEGHEFVLDGCNKDGFFHVNWGWNGYLDGYFRLTSLRPDDYGTGGSITGYSFDMDITIGIQPNKNPETTDELTYKIVALGDLRFGYSDSDTVMVTSNANMYFTTINGEQNGTMNGFANFGSYSFEGYGDIFRTKWTDTKTGDTIFTGEKYFVRGIAPGQYTSGIDISYFWNDVEEFKKLKPNTIYNVSLVTEDTYSESKDIRDVEFMVGRNSFVQVEIIGDSMRIVHPKTPITLKSDLSGFPERTVTKANQSFDIPFTNISDQEYVGEVRFRFNDSSGEAVPELTEYIMLDLLPGEATTEKLILYNLGKAAPGTYTAYIYMIFATNSSASLKQ